jgi:hypothetical protein
MGDPVSWFLAILSIVVMVGSPVFVSLGKK